ncbi:hypothetical protein L207DRAFT_567507 [Hyaloscypha variabilis F]|uniref:Heterokaryon incompatibility domain-containing protein n=1 Tax=Hyaloscypha variabilis (strain UAMH 11265 / GT02V1 / F) TaxID=1149755 RepID=A0A2J6RL13_HYAVF|nr:hypothetical protein L207DRAFT_567507 [Hyaloscypha variabilis F]
MNILFTLFGYAYLSDVPSAKENPHAPSSAFRQSKWFTRGWTLQELLAPMVVVFYDAKWVEIGTKSSLEKLVSHTTRIRSTDHREEASTAQKTSRAAMRQTTRIEDTAYCLLGLSSVNMPLLYGEGEKAFLRL